MANNIKGITVEIGGNTAPLQNALKDVNKTSRNLQSELREVNRQLKFDPTNTEMLKQKQKLLGDEIQNTKEKLVTLKDAEKQVQNQFKQGKISEEQYRALQREVVKTEIQLKNLKNQAAQSNVIFSKIRDTAEKFEDVAGKVSSKMMPATLAIAGAGTAAVKMGAEYEDILAKVSTIADTNKKSLKELSKETMALSDKTGVAADQINDALYQAISAGADTAKATGLVEVAVKSAKGGFTDTATAVDGLTSVLNTYGMKTEEADKLANQFLVTQNLGKTTFGELANSIGNVAPVAASAGMSTESLLSSIAALTANGINTSEAVTGMKAALSNIIKPTKEASQAADSLGLKFNTSELATKGWIPFLQEVKTKLKDAAPEYVSASEKVATLTEKIEKMSKSGNKNTAEMKNLKAELKAAKANMESLEKASSGQLSAFATMFGSVEGLNTVLTLTSDNGMEMVNKAMKEMQTNTTAVDDAYNKVNDTTLNKFKKSLNELTNQAIEIGQMLMPIVNKIIAKISELAKNFAAVSPAGKQMIITIALIIAAIAPIAKIVQGVALAVQAVTDAQIALNAAQMANPVGLIVSAVIAVVAAIALLVAGIKHLWNTNEGFRNAILNVWRSIKSAVGAIGKWFSTDFVNFFKGAWSGITGAFSSVPGFFSKLGSKISGALNTAGNFIKENVKSMITSGLEAMKNVFGPFLESMKNVMLAIWVPIQKGLTTAWNGIKIAAGGAWNLIKNVILGPILLLIDLVTGNFGKLKSDMNHIWLNIRNAIKNVWNGILTFYKGIWKAIFGGFTAYWTVIINGIASACSQAKKVITTTWHSITQFFAQTWANIKAGIISAWNGFSTTVSTKCNTIKAAIINIWNAVIAWFRTLPGTLMAIGANMFTSMRNGVNSTVNNVVTAVKAGIGAAIDWIKCLPADAMQWGRDIIGGIVDGIQSAVRYVEDAVKGVATSIRKFLHFSKPDEGPLADFDTYMPDMMDSIRTGILNNIGKVSDAAKQVAAAMTSVIPTEFDTSIRVNTAMAAVHGGPAIAAVRSNNELQSTSQSGSQLSYTQIVNNYSPTALSPAESARLTRNATRQLLLARR